MDITIQDIPTHSSLVIQLAPTADDLERIFAQLDEFSLAPGASVEGKVRLQRIGTSIRVSGDVNTTLMFTCGRCLETREVAVSAELEYLLVPKPQYATRYEGQEETELSEEDLGVTYYEGEELDLRPYVRESLMLELPSYPNCEGIGMLAECDAAYERNIGVEAIKDNESGRVDLRWAKLMELKKQGDSN